MSISVDDLIEFSKKLLDEETETCWRSSASRAYYAAYHSAKNASLVCPDNSHFQFDAGTHGKLIDRFLSWDTQNLEHKKIGKQIGYVLRDMKRTREMADYDLHANFKKSQASMRFEQIIILKNHLDMIWAPSDLEASS
jgi:uncharacterized protein (UPF0332 family)